jgi:hypothetical protein
MSARISVLTANYTCSTSLAGQMASGGFLVFIKAAVGPASPPRCRNFADDVKAIQKALNRFSPLQGGPPVPLVVDGLFGPKTGGAIRHFQEKWELKPKNWQVPDGIVDPVGPTIERLRKGPGALANLPVAFLARIPRVMEIVTAARAVLTLAKSFYATPPSISPLPSLSLFGRAAADKVDRHFHQNTLPNPVQRVEDVNKIFLGMQTAIGFVPQGVVLAVDEPPGIARGSFMFSFSGGYDHRGINETWNGIPVGSIYLCPKSRTLTADAFAYAMIHELAHYVGPSIPGIDDWGYFHKDATKYKNLSPHLALHNADSYSQFAFDAIGQADFNIELHRT